LSNRQIRWMEHIQRFKHDITYVQGVANKVGDCLSRYYEFDTWEDDHPVQDFVIADLRLDPTGDDLPQSR
ncbi:hypothetical protein BD410DRAFT_690066, partial [Rickenella mellea]